MIENKNENDKGLESALKALEQARAAFTRPQSLSCAARCVIGEVQPISAKQLSTKFSIVRRSKPTMRRSLSHQGG